MIIDYIENFRLPDDKAKTQFNELRSLDYLATGLWFLYEQVQGVEAKIIEGLPKGKRVSMFGDAPEMQGINQDLVACAFHWYAVTVCNYVKMVGWLANDGDSKKTLEYIKHVIPAVYIWRNKVAAHFAKFAPRKEDNPADLAKSVMFPISFDDNAFYVSSWTLTLGISGKSHTSRQDMRWSLTHIHRELVPRYWPKSATKEQG